MHLYGLRYITANELNVLWPGIMITRYLVRFRLKIANYNPPVAKEIPDGIHAIIQTPDWA
jgi:hypothetical protein